MKTLLRHEQAKLSSVINNGIVVAIVNSNDSKQAYIYCHNESRGYQSNYAHKDYFYIVIYDGCSPVAIHGITKDSRRKNYESWWQEQGYNYRIVNEALFDKLLS